MSGMAEKRAVDPRSGRKDQVVRMRVSASEKEAMEKTAARSGLSVSAWLRQLALRAAGVLRSDV
jgi:hypothetical protein